MKEKGVRRSQKQTKPNPGEIGPKRAIRQGEAQDSEKYHDKGGEERGTRGQSGEVGHGDPPVHSPRVGELEGLSHISISNVSPTFIPNFGLKD